MIDERGWHRRARLARSANFDSRPPKLEPSLLVIHSISLPKGCYGNGLVERLFLNRLDCGLYPSLVDLEGLRVSAHFLLSRQGRLTQFVSCLDRAWHAGESSHQGVANCNDFSIGIEVEGHNQGEFTDGQYHGLARLAAALLERFPGLDSQAIVGHQHIAPSRKSDPGEGFDWSRLFGLLADARSQALPQS